MPLRTFVAGPVAGLLMALGLAATAHADAPFDASGATYCQPGSSNADGVQLGDVTFSGNMPTSAADDCYGIVKGNDSESAINGLGLTWGTDWEFLVKDGDTASFGGVTYSLDVVDPGQASGTWTLTASPAELLPVYVDFIAMLKAGNDFALWYFDDVRIGGDDGGVWSSVFSNKPQNAYLGLSHMSLYVRQGDVPPPPEIPPPGTVPEPSGLALAALALVAAGVARRRRRA